MRLTIDASPMLVNRTAMHTISADVIDTLADHIEALQFVGVRRDEPPTAEASARLRDILGALLDASRGGDFSTKLADARAPRVSDSPILFLDPLYVLFADLRADDTVLLLDLSPVTTPQWHPPAVSRLYAAAFARIASVQPRLLAISRNTAATFAANFGEPRREIGIVPLYVPRALTRQAEETSVHAVDPFFLFVGSLEARKNVVGAIEAFVRSGLGERGYQLVIAGGAGHGAEAVHAMAIGTRNVHLLGYVDDETLHALYRSAAGFVYPSYLEGFGVPLLEAMLYGAPAVASITGACPEVGGDLVPYCDPDDPAAIARQMVRIADMDASDRAAWARAARARVEAHFSFERFQQTLREHVLAPR